MATGGSDGDGRIAERRAGTEPRAVLLLLPAGIVFTGLLVLPAAMLLVESLRQFQPGRVGSAPDTPWTFENYGELASASFVHFAWTTLRISVAASLAGLVIAFPIAYWTVRRLSARARGWAVGLLVLLMFLSVLVRTYALELTFGAVGPVRPILLAMGVAPNSGAYIEFVVGAGLMHYLIPLSALTLIATIQNLDPRLVEGAQSLGAPAWKAHLSITLPLAVPGLLAAFLFSFTFSISAFVIPMVLGRGRVVFISNLIYNRFSEIANYPSGAAISIVMLVIALFAVITVSRLVARRFG